jgi:hypothetical protein
MDASHPVYAEQFRVEHSRFEQTVLLLQGGGALGSYQAGVYEALAKDFEFSRRTMEEHWAAGYDDVVCAISHPEVLQHPDKMEGVRTFDHHRHE